MKKNKIDEAFDMEIIDIESFDQHEIIEYRPNLPSVRVKHEPYDNKDSEIEQEFQSVYDKAMEAFDTQQDLASDVEGKYLARNSEVANQLLGTALAAAKEKANLKRSSDQLQLKKSSGNPGDGSVTNIQNNIVMDRNQLLKMMKGE